MKLKKAYLLQGSHTGFGFRVSPVIVVSHEPGGKTALVLFLNMTEKTAWVPVLAKPGLTVQVADLASTRLKALAKIALRLRDLEESLALHGS